MADKKHVSIIVENDRPPKPPSGNYKAKFGKMASVTEKYERIANDRIYSDDLMKAVSKNDLDACKVILANKKVPNDTYIFHPLLLAAKKGHPEIIELLLEKEANINILDNKKSSALHSAIQQGNVECCELLLKHGIKTDIADAFGNLPIHVAAKEGLLPVYMKLDNDESRNAINKKAQTPLHCAAMNGHDQILERLLQREGRWDWKDINLWLPLHWAAFHGHDKCCKILIENSGSKLTEHLNSRNKDKATPLILAAKKGHSRCCDILRESDIDATDSNGNTALHLATSVGFLKTVEVLLEMNPNLQAQNSAGNTPIHKAATQKNLDCLKLLVEKLGTNPGLNKMKQTVIHLAAMNNCEESLRYILNNPIFSGQKNVQDSEGKTALHLSLCKLHCETSEILLNAGIDCTLTDHKGSLALHAAAGNGLYNICKILLSGSRVQLVNHRNLMGTTPLHLAAMNGSVDCCKFLLTKGADLTIIDSNGFSPFHIAAKEGRLDVIKLFTKKSGGYINQPVEVSGNTTLHLVAKKGFTDCCSFILKNMKKDVIGKLNNWDNSALDEAFEAENDEIFSLILSKTPFPNVTEKFNVEQYFPFQSSLHKYMHVALESKEREIVVEAIVKSKWWFSGFSNNFCEEDQCPNLIMLIRLDPSLMKAVYDNCIEENGHLTKYDFRLLENSYHIPIYNGDNNYLTSESPFYDDTGKLKENAELIEKQHNHPLIEVVKNDLLEIMQHQLTKAFLNYKWNSYIKFLCFLMIFIEFLYVLAIGLYLVHVKNYEMFNKSLGITREKLCSSKYEDSTFDFTEVTENSKPTIITFGYSVIMAFCMLLIEIYSGIKKRDNLKLDPGKRLRRFWEHMRRKWSVISTVEFVLRITRVVGFMFFLMPLSFCYYDMLIKEAWQWQIGIVTLLVSWFYFIRTLNDIPAISVFMPVTSRFMKSFAKVLMYIVLIVSIFAFIFHLLLQRTEAFEGLPVAFVKTVIWLLGDLGYDEVFLDKDNPIGYPLMTNVIFLLLVTTIGGFIVNMIIAQPTDHLDLFREKAIFHKAASRIKLYLKLDMLSERLRRKFVIAFHKVEGKKRSISISEAAVNNGKQDSFVEQNNELLNKILTKLERLEIEVAETQKSETKDPWKKNVSK